MTFGFWRKLVRGFRSDPAAEGSKAGPCVVDLDAPSAASPALAGTSAGEGTDAGEGGGDDQPASGPPPTADEVRALLTRSLEWRAKTLVERSSAGPRLGDGPALVSSLRGGGEEQIRQIPFAAQRALTVSRNPNSGSAELVSLFEQDPTLTRDLLQTANSAWYARGDEAVISIVGAVQRVGYRAIENILMANIVRGLLCRPGGAYTALVGQVWSHMLRTATLAQRLAAPFGIDPETAYTLGLLHDVGKLAIFDHISSLRQDLHREVQMPEVFLHELLERLHEPIGGRAVLRWGLDVRVARAVAGHHRRPVPETADPLTELLFVADRLDGAGGGGLEKPDWEGLWREGALTVPRAAVEECWEGSS